jgi:hypothetical protein
MLPIAKLLRKRSRQDDSVSEIKGAKKTVKLSDLDSLITGLEKKGGAATDDSDSDSNSDGSSNSDSDGDDSSDTSGKIVVEETDTGNIVKLVSSNFDDVIAPLPVSMLPLPMGKPKIKTTDREKKVKSGKRAVKFDDERDEKTAMGPEERNGLEKTVREMLKNYEPASYEKRPFYCRICRFQGADLDELKIHQRSEEHKIAEDIERRMSFCRICKKQFTSPEQLKEHNKGKPHKLALDKLKERQARAKKFS